MSKKRKPFWKPSTGIIAVILYIISVLTGIWSKIDQLSAILLGIAFMILFVAPIELVLEFGDNNKKGDNNDGSPRAT